MHSIDSIMHCRYIFNIIMEMLLCVIAASVSECCHSETVAKVSCVGIFIAADKVGINRKFCHNREFWLKPQCICSVTIRSPCHYVLDKMRCKPLAI